MSSTTITSLKRSRSSTPSLGTRPSTPSPVTAKDPSTWPDLASGEPQIKQELDRWENIVFSFGMDDSNEHPNNPKYPSDYPIHPSQQNPRLPRARGQVPSQASPSGLPASWDMAPFFPPSAYDQRSPYDMLSLGAISPMPGLTSPHSQPHGNPHALDPFGHPSSWDLGFYPELQQPAPQLQPLTPGEIAQYHALMARGAGGFPPPAPPVLPLSTPISGASSSSAPASASMSQAAPSARGRSVSSAGRSSSQGQSPSTPASPVEEETAAIAEDKRRRNTAASGKLIHASHIHSS